jgi:serine/threonine protein kinase
MAHEGEVFGNRWQVVRELGKGGQGVVYEVLDMGGTLFGKTATSALGGALSDFDRVHGNLAARDEAASALVRIIQDIARGANPGRGALKELLPVAEAVNAATALERMKAEVETLRSIRHPHLIAVLDDQVTGRGREHWFVTEFFERGTLSRQGQRFQGRVLEALQAFHGIVDAVAQLHMVNRVHRDIKPANIFIADDERLVLGDCGLAIRLGNAERLTTTYENVGTRDYMPAWAQSMRVEDVTPAFDVFSLGKLLWAMISGKPHCPLWYVLRPPFDLALQFPTNTDIRFVRELLAQCVAEEQEDMEIRNAQQLRDRVDEIIRLLESSSEFPSNVRTMRCRFCGVGHYDRISGLHNDQFQNLADRRYTYRCDTCGHLESFFWKDDQPPRAWKEPYPPPAT